VEVFGAYVDLLYAHHFIPERRVTESRVDLKTSPFTANEQPRFVGDGTYTASLNIVGLGVRIPWDNLRGAL
jgi:hypothetical protein